ncbi:glycoside hydrolase family 88 protein, partial [Bacteroides faecichinchillae]|uniref:glycoside hydrolase family 88 protein n=2 Tax=Bacteroides TaxID=816 RepID=UPI0035161528
MTKNIFILLLFPFQLLFAQTDMLNNFPKGCTPEEVGERLAYRFETEYILQNRKWVSYSDIFTWSGAVQYAAVTKDKKLAKLLQNKFDSLFTVKKNLLPTMRHVDWNMFGSLPLTLYQKTKKKKYLKLGLPYADTQWEVPENAKPSEKEWAGKGYSWQTRLWIDDMYMIT